MEVRELQQILDQHKKWLFYAPDGVRADLSGMDLRGMDLSGMDLSKADCEEDAFQEALRACDSDFHFKALEEVWIGDYSIEQIDDEEEGL